MNPAGRAPSDHYDALEVSRSASPEVLRAAYKSLIQRYHPDRNPGDASAAQRSARVVQAYQVLSDPVARTAYDLELRQSERPRPTKLRPLDAPDLVAPTRSAEQFRWLFWVPAVLLAVLLWFIWTTFFKPSAADSAPKTIASAQDKPQLKDAAEKAAQPTRTVPDFIENLNVTLLPSKLPEGASDRETTRVLSIRTLGGVAGGFDPDKYTELLKSSQDYIARKLSERLAKADYEMLVKHDGERYLKKLIVDSISEITNATPPTGKSPATHYGVVEVLLPESFSVESREPGQVTVQIHRPG